MSFIVDDQAQLSPFGELHTVTPQSVMNYKPTWGVSDLRYDSVITGAGAAINESSGEFRLSSGTATSNVAQLTTLARGQYQAGATARFGVGVRVPVAPASTAVMTWGYFDDDEGILFGVDATGVFVSRRSGGTDNKIYQSAFNVDTLDGSGGAGNPSGLTLSLADGVICQSDFTWYGYGIIIFKFAIYDSATGVFETIEAHRLNIDEQVSIIDPNQPLRFAVINGASNTTSYDLYIGGHQFEYFNGQRNPQARRVSQLLTNYTTATNTNWQPLISIRPKAAHGASGRTNSVVIRVTSYSAAADGEAETRLTYGGVTSNLSFAAPTGWTAAESAAETKVTGGTALTASTDGFPSNYGFIDAAKNNTSIIQRESQMALGQDKEVILWVRRLSAAGAIIVKHAHIEWSEEW